MPKKREGLSDNRVSRYFAGITRKPAGKVLQKKVFRVIINKNELYPTVSSADLYG
ncbi:MAG TPA: hypothetical protein PK965_02855 [Anaerohalosphaeraceae bacterium]|nr:hypothetical protein [Anaerohalosphaeraceae bacterium]